MNTQPQRRTDDATLIQPAAESLLRAAGLDPDVLPGRKPIQTTGRAPSLDSCHRLVAGSAAALAAQAMAAETFWRSVGGAPQEITLDLLQAAAALYPVRFQRQNGYPMPLIPGAEFAQDFCETADGKWFYIVASYPALRNRALEILDCANTRPAVARAVKRSSGDALESLFAEHGVPAAYVRSAAEWREHPQGRCMAGRPTIEIRRIGDAPPRVYDRTPARPFAGVRVLDASHVIAGPVAARTLAEHGAQALRVSAPYQQDPLVQIMDTGIGKRTAFLDLCRAPDVERLQDLCRTADVFVDSWRPGSLARKGFSAQQAAQLRPGIVYLSISTYGPRGPWAGLGGFEQIGQIVSGICHDESRGGRPRLVPTHFLNDYLTGYLGAAGVGAALAMSLQEGGSYHVNVSLTATSMWVQSLGQRVPDERPEDLFALTPALEARDSPYGRLEQLPPVAQLSLTPAAWHLPPAPLGAHRAEWLEESFA